MGQVTDDKAEQQFELREDGHVAVAAYRIEDGAVVFTHTVVPEALGGRGVGGRLIAGALADVAARGMRVVPLCSFVRAYIDKHPEHRKLLAEGGGHG